MAHFLDSKFSFGATVLFIARRISLTDYVSWTKWSFSCSSTVLAINNQLLSYLVTKQKRTKIINFSLFRVRVSFPGYYFILWRNCWTNTSYCIKKCYKMMAIYSNAQEKLMFKKFKLNLVALL